MPKLPRIKPVQAIRALKRAGFYVDHITGSHYILFSCRCGSLASVLY